MKTKNSDSPTAADPAPTSTPPAAPTPSSGSEPPAQPLSALTVEKLGAAVNALGGGAFSWADQLIAGSIVDFLSSAAASLAAGTATDTAMAGANALLGLLKASTANLVSSSLPARVQKAIDALA